MKHITLPKLPKLLTKRVLYIAGGSLLILGLLSFAVASQVKAERLERAETTAKAQAVQSTIESLQSRVVAAEKAVETNSKAATERAEICNWVRSVVPKYRIAVPPLCLKG